MKLNTIKSSQIKRGTRILMRIDCDVPIKNHEVDSESSWRLERAVDDIKNFVARGAIVILIGHLGRPDGNVKLSLSLKPIERWYEKKLNKKLVFIKDLECDCAVDKLNKLTPGSVAIVENLRFFKGEEKNDSKFAKALSCLADVYVNNAFGVCHRKHASVSAITKCLPSYAGSSLINEISNLSKPIAHPFTLVLGGVKLETKMPILMRLGKDADSILVGGGVALAMTSIEQKKVLQINGQNLSRSELSFARKALKKFRKKIILPVDYVCVREGNTQTIMSGNVRPTDAVVDIGPSTIKLFSSSIRLSKSVVFNGAMGSLKKNAQAGTESIAKALSASRTKHSIVGGGDTVGFLQSKKLLNHFSFVSSGGGAMLAYLSGEKLPGLEALKQK